MDFNPELNPHWNRLLTAVGDVPHGPQLAYMLQQQYQHNLNQAGRDWCRSGFNWLRYLRVELYELMEHYNSYKHWKKHSPDIPQARIEMIDVLIFAMSHVIENGDPEAFIRRLATYLEEAENSEFAQGLHAEDKAELVNTTCERIANVSFRGALDLLSMAELVSYLDLDAERLELLYQAKMALNHLRWENGYKEGKYLKTWFGQEDNAFVQENVIDDDRMRAALAEELDLQVALREVLEIFYQKALVHHREQTAP